MLCKENINISAEKNEINLNVKHAKNSNSNIVNHHKESYGAKRILEKLDSLTSPKLGKKKNVR
jgi:hypothetical protein